MLNNPKLALCANRSTLPKSNEKSGSPEEWFTNNLLADRGFMGINFDFFVDWSTALHTLTEVIWIKQILSPDQKYDDFLIDVKGNLIKRFGESFLRLLCKFSKSYSLKVYFVILNDEQDWKDPNSIVCMVNLEEGFAFTSEMLSIDNFKTLIKKYSGGPVYVGNKGLIYGTTSLECFLSKTDSAYPGDMDMLLLNENADPVAILEFKKHTLSPDISGQTLSKYYPNPDARKYDRLMIFKEYVLKRTGHDIPLIVFFYPSNSLGEAGRAEVIAGAAGKLFTKFSAKFILPVDNSDREYARMSGLIAKILKNL